MSHRSKAYYFAQIERVYSHCAVCGEVGARFSKKDGRTLCKTDRAALRSKDPDSKPPITRENPTANRHLAIRADTCNRP